MGVFVLWVYNACAAICMVGAESSSLEYPKNHIPSLIKIMEYIYG